MWLFTAPNGLIFHAGPSKRMHWLDVSGNGSYQLSELRGDDDHSMTGIAVMYDTGKILKAGGSTSYSSGTPGNRKAYVIDINDDQNVQVNRVGDMISRRTHLNAVVLPSGEVVVVGGIMNARIFTEDAVVLQTEIWSPVTNQFSPLPPLHNPRVYHSTAILLHDGRVLAAGGGLCGNCGVNRPDAEILTPPYLLDASGNPVASRPIIVDAPTNVDVGETFLVEMDSSADHTFAFVRLSAVTHSTNNDQRRIPLEVANDQTGVFELQVPNNSAVALPGTYFLFAMNAAGVPSVAATVTINV